jgi:hypothetical protein
MTREEAEAAFADLRESQGLKYALLAECKQDIETIASMVDALGAAAMRRKKAEEFRKAFGLPNSAISDLMTIFYGDVEARLAAGRRVWKLCDQIQKGEAE